MTVETMPYKNMAWIRNPIVVSQFRRYIFRIYSISSISFVETSCYEQHLHYHTRENCLSRDMGFFLEKIALLEQLSGRTNSLIMITMNHLVLQNGTRNLI